MTKKRRILEPLVQNAVVATSTAHNPDYAVAKLTSARPNESTKSEDGRVFSAVQPLNLIAFLAMLIYLNEVLTIGRHPSRSSQNLPLVYEASSSNADPPSDFVIDSASVSRFHCKIYA